MEKERQLIKRKDEEIAAADAALRKATHTHKMLSETIDNDSLQMYAEKVTSLTDELAFVNSQLEANRVNHTKWKAMSDYQLKDTKRPNPSRKALENKYQATLAMIAELKDEVRDLTCNASVATQEVDKQRDHYINLREVNKKLTKESEELIKMKQTDGGITLHKSNNDAIDNERSELTHKVIVLERALKSESQMQEAKNEKQVQVIKKTQKELHMLKKELALKDEKLQELREVVNTVKLEIASLKAVKPFTPVSLPPTAPPKSLGSTPVFPTMSTNESNASFFVTNYLSESSDDDTGGDPR